MDFWANGNGTIAVEDMYLTNNDDYSPQTAIGDVAFAGPTQRHTTRVHSLSGQLLRSGAGPQLLHGLPAGIYLVNGKKVVHNP